MAEKPKYIAEGFQEDLIKLLRDFVKASSTHFTDFAKIWRVHHFSLIFMGRPDPVELSEFTNEIFRITSVYLSSTSFLRKIGAVYTLYALFRNQIANPPVKIRIEMSHWLIIKELLQSAIHMKIRTLHYVIEYLMEFAFLYVAHQTVKGPLVGTTHKVSKYTEEIANLKAVYKSDLKTLSSNNNLEALRDLDKEYLEAKKNICGLVENLSLEDQTPKYNSIIEDMNKLVNSEEEIPNVPESLGSRRAKIKAASFAREARDRFGQLIHDDNIDDDSDNDMDFEICPRLKSQRNKRVPKEKRKVGRPPKIPKAEVPDEPKSDDEIDISHLLAQQNDFYLPPEEDAKKLKSRPGRYYYKLSPKKDNNPSEDDPM